VQALRLELHKVTTILPAAQKITFRGLIKENDKTLKELKIGEGAHPFHCVFYRMQIVSMIV
jgi:hypothetical protein